MLDLIVLLEQMKDKFNFNFELAIKGENYGYQIRISTFDYKYGVTYYEQFFITEEPLLRRTTHIDLLKHKFEATMMELIRTKSHYRKRNLKRPIYTEGI